MNPTLTSSRPNGTAKEGKAPVWRIPPLRFVIPAIILIVGLSAVTAVTVVLVRLSNARTDQLVSELVNAIGDGAAASIADGLRNEDPARTRGSIEKLQSFRNLTVSLLVDGEGQVQQGSRKALVGQPLSAVGEPLLETLFQRAKAGRTTVRQIAGEHLYYARPIGGLESSGGPVTGTYVLLLVYDFQNLNDAHKAGAFNLALVAALPVLGLSLLSWYFLQRAMLDRLNRLVTASGRIGSGDLQTPVPIGGRDEIGTLGEAFDSMRMNLAKTQERIAAFTELGRRLSVAKTEREASEIIAAISDKLFGWDACAITLYDAAKDRISVILTADTVDGQKVNSRPGYNDRPPSPLTRKVITEGAQLILRQSVDAFLPGGVSFGDTSRPSASLIYVPVRDQLSVVGIISIQSYQLDAYGAEDLDAMQAMADFCAGALTRIRAEQNQRLAEKALQNNQVRLLLAVEASQIGPWEWNRDTNEVFFSPEWKRQLGYADHELPNEFATWESRLHPDDRERALSAVADFQARPELGYDVEFRLRHRDGSYRWIYTHGIATLDPFDQSRLILGCHLDITERKQAEKVLRASDEKHRLLFQRNPMPMWVHGITYDRFLAVNEAAIVHYGYSRDEFLAMRLRDIEAPSDSRALARPAGRGTNSDLAGTEIARHRLKDGRLIWVETAESAMIFDEVPARLMLAEDVTKRINAERAQTESLQEKETLLKEIHHRVKNNLQIVSSLLDMQMSSDSNPDTLNLLRESVNRVRSMAMIHERLYRGATLARVEFGDYADSLAHAIFTTYEIRGRVRLMVECDNVNLNIETAVPCGLILNELVSNACKHAFPNQTEGHLRVSINRVGATEFTMEVHDSGPGLPAGFDIKASKSLGLQLVSTLARQLKARLTTVNDRGARITLHFEELNMSQSV